MSCKNCLSINHTRSVLPPEESEHVNIQNFKKLTKAPLIRHECVLIPSTDNINFGPNAKDIQIMLLAVMATN